MKFYTNSYFEKSKWANFWRNFFCAKNEIKGQFWFQSGFAYESVSSSSVARTNSSTFINSSTVSQDTCFSAPSLEYRYTVRLTGSITHRVRYSSCIRFIPDYLISIARHSAPCQGVSVFLDIIVVTSNRVLRIISRVVCWRFTLIFYNQVFTIGASSMNKIEAINC